MKKIIKIFAAIFLIFILAGCNGKTEKSVLPELTGKTKPEIEEIFNGFKEDISLTFEFEYSNDIPEFVFIKYKEPNKVGDTINSDDEITIVVAKEKLYLPDLTNKNKTEIETEFDQINEALAPNEINLSFQYSYPTNDNEDLFVSYLNNKNAGDIILKDSTIEILVNGKYAIYPDIENKTESEIADIFNALFASYYDLSYKIVYQTYYNPDLDEGTIISYGQEIEPGDKIKDLNNIIILKSTKTFILPDLRGLTIDEIKEVFTNMNIPLSRLDLRMDYSQYVNAGEFIKYEDGLNRGDTFDINNKRLIIYYDLRPILPVLEGYNRQQIDAVFANSLANISYEYILNNDMEYDLFAGYKNHDAGDEIISGMDVVINLYKNDDVNDGDMINVTEQLMFSKYISGTGSNLGIELYNPTQLDIILDDYYIAIVPSGQVIASITIQLSGIIQAKGTYVIVNSNADTLLLNKSNMQTSLMNFGANSTIQLRRVSNNTYIDTIYDLNNTDTEFDREIMVRKSHLTHGRRNTIYLEWQGFLPTYYDIIGVHPYYGPEDPEFELIEDKTFQEYGMTKVKYLSAADGDTVYLESLDPRDPTSYSGDSRVRFLLVDTPETQKPGVTGEPYAQVASNFTKNMLASASEIYLQASFEGGIIDTYGRHLGLIWANVGTVENPDWKLLNYELLKAGLGQIQIAKTGNYQNHPIFSNRYLYQWAQEADNYARENKLGLYSGIHKD